MGCSCLKDEIKIECENEILQNNNTIDEIIKSNPDLLIQIIKIQGIIKGRFFRKNFYKNTLNINCEEEDYEDEFKNYKQITTDKIAQKELEVLFKLYPSLDDGIEVEVQSPVQFDNGLIYFGEWTKKIIDVMVGEYYYFWKGQSILDALKMVEHAVKGH